MDPEVIFILVLILFSMIEGALRKKKGAGKQLPGSNAPPGGWPKPGDFPEGEGSAEGRSGGAPLGTPAGTPPQRTAEGMVPDDVWKEIEALARGDVDETLELRRARKRKTGKARPTLPTPVPPPPQPPTREPSKWRQMPTPPTASPQQQQQPHPSSEAPLQRSRDPRPRTFRAEAEARPAPRPEVEVAAPERVALRYRTQKKPKAVPKTEAELHHGFRGPHALKLAFVAREVLGRPLALRDFGEEEFWS